MSLRDQDSLVIQRAYKPLNDQDRLTIGESSKVIIIAPTAGQTNFPEGGLYQWLKLQDYDYYKVQTASSDTFGTLIEDKIVKAEQLTSTLSAATGYWIRVEAMEISTGATQDEATGVSITPDTATVTEGEELTLTGNVEGVGTYDETGTWAKISGDDFPFSISGNDITLSPTVGESGEAATFEFTSNEGGFSEQRTITVTEASAFDETVDSPEGDLIALNAIYASTQGESYTELNNTSEIPDQDPGENTTYLIDGDLWLAWESGGSQNTRNIGSVGWNTSTGWPIPDVASMGDAYGVTVDANDRVIALDLFRNNLVGILPLEVGNLKKCVDFKVKQSLTAAEWDDVMINGSSGIPGDSKLKGEVPWTIGLMADLDWCSLAGQTADIDLGNSAWNSYNHGSGLSGKTYNQGNTFTGQLDSRIYDALNVRMFECRRQKITGGISTKIGQWTELVGIFINGVSDTSDVYGLTGAIPTEVNDCTKLKHIHFEWNHLSEQCPDFLLPELRHLRIERNELHCDTKGELPDLSTTDLRTMGMGHNDFSGPFPLKYFNGINKFLNRFDISWNRLDGDLPADEDYVGPNHPSFVDGTFDTDGHHSMTIFNIGQIFFGDTEGGFTGDIPDWIQRMEAHTQVKINHNAFDAPFPVKICELETGRLRLFNIEYNRNNGHPGFRDALPDVNWSSPALLQCYLQGNSLSNIIPDSWVSLKTSTRSTLRIGFHDNLFIGRIPSWFREVTNAKYINFSTNGFDEYRLDADGHGFIIPPVFEDSGGNPATYADFQAGNADHVEGFLSAIEWNFRSNDLTQTDVDNIILDMYDLVQWWRSNSITSSPTLNVSSNTPHSAGVQTEVDYLNTEINLIT